MISGFFLLPEICCPALVAGTEGSLGWAVSHPLLLLPSRARSCPFPARCKLRTRPRLHTCRKKNLPLPPIPTAVEQTRLHSEQRFLPIFLADEPCAPPCHCCQQTPAAALLHGPRNGLTVKNCSSKNGSKNLKKNSNSLMML